MTKEDLTKFTAGYRQIDVEELLRQIGIIAFLLECNRQLTANS